MAPLLACALDAALCTTPAVWLLRAEHVGWRQGHGDSPCPPQAGLKSKRVGPHGLEAYRVGPLVASFRRQQAVAESTAQGGSGDPARVH